MQFIQQLEALGQSASLKQFSSASDMLIHNKLNQNLLTQVQLNSNELFCLVEPDDDEDEN